MDEFKELSLEEQHKICLEILIDVDGFCKNHNIKYFLAYGTLLGAIRHKGFIPWDDDIDIVMLRSDYDKFMSIYKSDKYELFDIENQGYYVGVSKVADKVTRLEQFIPQAKEAIGVSIDIFVLDYESADENEFKKQVERLSYLKRCILQQRVWIRGKKLLKAPKTLLRLILFSIRHLKFSIEKTRRDLNTNAKKYIHNDNVKYVGCLTGAVKNVINERYPFTWFMESIDVEFEDHFFPAPKDYDKYLTHIYGDYMLLPPEDKRYIVTDSKFYYI